MNKVKSVYPMSSVGGCPRAVVAQRLGYDQVEPPGFMQRAAREGQRHEEWVAHDLAEHGWTASPPARCEPCGRDGIHVEIDRRAYMLVGHLDRTAAPAGGHTSMVEIKSLGRFRAEKLVRSLGQGKFKDEFREYAVQVSCYHYASGLPILYAVKNRDTGTLDLFEIPPPFSLEDIDRQVLQLEVAARRETLPKCEYRAGDFERTICHFKYLCSDEDKKEVDHEVVDESTLAAAAESWRRARALDAEAKELDRAAREVFLPAARAAGRPLLINGLKLSYVKAGVTVSYPKAKLEAIVSKEVLEQVREERERAEYVKVEESVQKSAP